MKKMKSKKMKSKKISGKSELAQLRKEISSLDKAFMDVFKHYLKRREDLAKSVGLVKKSADMPIKDPSIEVSVKQRFVKGVGKSLGETVAAKLAKAVLQASRKQQKKALKKV